MITPFRFFAGGPLGSGRQYMSWIHRIDWIEMIRWIVETPTVTGAVNATAPVPVTNREFARALGRAMHRPCTDPRAVVRADDDSRRDGGSLVLTGQRAIPQCALVARAFTSGTQKSIWRSGGYSVNRRKSKVKGRRKKKGLERISPLTFCLYSFKDRGLPALKFPPSTGTESPPSHESITLRVDRAEVGLVVHVVAAVLERRIVRRDAQVRARCRRCRRARCRPSPSSRWPRRDRCPGCRSR